MRVDVVLRYIGVVMLFIAMFMLLSAGISYLSGMDSAFYPLLLSSLLTALLGAFPLIFVGKREQITNKEGFCIVVGSWLVACVVGMFPYLICAVCPLVGEYEPGNPICGFLFPAFVDRSGDLERVDIYAERAAWGDRMASILGAKGRKFRCGL